MHRDRGRIRDGNQLTCYPSSQTQQNRDRTQFALSLPLLPSTRTLLPSHALVFCPSLDQQPQSRK